MTPEERAAKREAAIQGMVAKGYTRQRAEAILGMVAEALFGPGGRFATPAASPTEQATEGGAK